MLQISKRTCRKCGRSQMVMAGVDRCPHCGEEYGRLEMGLDRVPAAVAETAEAWQPLPERPPEVDGQIEMDD